MREEEGGNGLMLFLDFKEWNPDSFNSWLGGCNVVWGVWEYPGRDQIRHVNVGDSDE